MGGEFKRDILWMLKVFVGNNMRFFCGILIEFRRENGYKNFWSLYLS